MNTANPGTGRRHSSVPNRQSPAHIEEKRQLKKGK